MTDTANMAGTASVEAMVPLEAAVPERATALRAPVPWRNIAVEFAAIVFGVVLGLALNEWRLSVREERAAAEAAEAIREELEANFEIVGSKRRYHAEQYEIARRLRSEGAAGGLDWRGVDKPNTTRAALDAAVADGTFARLDRDEARTFMQLYNELGDIEETAARFGDMSAARVFTSYDDFLNFAGRTYSAMLYDADDALFKMSTVLDLRPETGWWELKPAIDSRYPLPGNDSDGAVSGD